MKIGVLYNGSLYDRTGAGKVVRSFIDYPEIFASNGIEKVNMYCFSQANVSAENNKPSLFQRIKDTVRKYTNKSYVGCLFFIYYHWFRRGSIAAKKYFSESNGEEEALIFHEFFTCWSYLKLCRKKNIEIKPYVVISHDNGEFWKMVQIYFPKIKNRKIIDKLYAVSDLCVNNAKRIIFVSNTSLEIFKQSGLTGLEKATVIPNGIEDRKAPLIDRDYHKLNIVTVGTVNARKNQILIIEALGRLKEIPITLTLVGGGDKIEEWKQRAEELGVAERVQFLGPRDDVQMILEQNNLFIMSSLDEGLPISGIEAMRSGLPLILTDVGGNKELIRENGILISPELDDLCKAITWIYSNKNSTEIMGQKSYALFKDEYVIEKMIEKYSRLAFEITN